MGVRPECFFHVNRVENGLVPSQPQRPRFGWEGKPLLIEYEWQKRYAAEVEDRKSFVLAKILGKLSTRSAAKPDASAPN